MEVQQKTDSRKLVFYIGDGGRELATMVCSFAGPAKLIIEHTEVKSGNEGKGLGKMLVEAAVIDARAKGYKIQPICPYALSVFEKTPAYKDVLF